MDVMRRLFDLAIEKVVNSPELIKAGAPVLPKKIAQYLLYLCCRASKREAVTVIIQHWPYSELVLCASLSGKDSCLSADEFYSSLHSGGFINTVKDLQKSIPSVTKGLFLHFSQNANPHLIVIDLSTIMVWGQNLDHVLSLVQGNFPVSHQSDYVSGEELSRVYGQSPPTLPCPPIPPTLIISVALTSATQAYCIRDMYSSQRYFNLEISSCDLSLLSRSHVPRLLSDIKSSACLRNLTIQPYQLPILVQSGQLPLSTRTTLSLLNDSSVEHTYSDLDTHLAQFCSKFDIRKIQIKVEYLNNPHPKFDVLITPLINITSFSLVGPNFQYEEESLSLPPFIERNCFSLEFFKVQGCLTLMPQCLQALGLCAGLRVLNVTQTARRQSLRMNCRPALVFSVIGLLAKLEYFEWEEKAPLRAEDLVTLYQTLSQSLTNLQHFHLHGFSALLFTTDLDNAENECIMELLQRLLKGKERDDGVSTHKFPFTNEKLNYLMHTTRPDVCFYVKPVRSI